MNTMVLSTYVITEDEILESQNFKYSDILVITNPESKNIFLYQGPESKVFDQFHSDLMYERIMNKFLNPNIFLITDLESSSADTSEIQEIKTTIREIFPEKWGYKFKVGFLNLFTLRKTRANIYRFKSYNQSLSFRKKIMNFSNYWALILFNLLSGVIILGLLGYTFFFGINRILSNNYSLEDVLYHLENVVIYIGLSFCLLISIIVIDMIFLLFPMKFPIKPVAIQTLISSSEKDQLND
jgi:hypothetical protein